jgi:hypothetical protein
MTPRAQEAADIVINAGDGITSSIVAARMHCAINTAGQHLATAQLCGLVHRRGMGPHCRWLPGLRPEKGYIPPQPRVNSIWQFASIATQTHRHG